VRDFINVSGRATVKEHVMFCGNPRPVADQMEEWLTAPACDGFVLAATSMPGAYGDAVRLLVPELQLARPVSRRNMPARRCARTWERRQRCGFYSEVNFWPSPRCSRAASSAVGQR
jgi:hypothetical protein